MAADSSGDAAAKEASRSRYQDAQRELNAAHAAGQRLVGKDFQDTNYVFLSFVTGYLPVGVVGLIVAVIFTAAMSSTSGEINSLAAVTVIDLYQRHFRKHASDHHYLKASRYSTVFWGIYAVVFAQFGRNFGALIEAVNIIGSLFYGGLAGRVCAGVLLQESRSARVRSSASWPEKPRFSPRTSSPRSLISGTTWWVAS